MVRAIVLLAGFALIAPSLAAAQTPGPFDAGIQVPVAHSGQFDAFDVGIGGRFAWNVSSPIGIEGEVNVYPGEFAGERPFSRMRVEGLFGVTVGPRLGVVRPFARARAGFLSVLGTSVPFPCILIYPPPLACALAAGDTLPAIDLGGGVELPTSGRMFVRVDVGDRIVRYAGPVLADRAVSTDGFFSHDFRFAVGAGLRF